MSAKCTGWNMSPYVVELNQQLESSLLFRLSAIFHVKIERSLFAVR